MPTAALNRRRAYKHAQRVAWRKVTDEAIILDVDTAVYFSLGGAGLRAWELLGKGKSVEQLARALAAEYDAPVERIEADVAELVERLRREKLIRAA